MGYCHCNSCRSWSGAPVNAFSLWKLEAVRIASGGEHIASFRKERAQPAPILREVRWASDDDSSAARPGGRVCRDHPEPRLRPPVHVNYEETVLRMRDGPPKLKDFPSELGGSGETIAE
jgi:hypothetical protein